MSTLAFHLRVARALNAEWWVRTPHVLVCLTTSVVRLTADLSARLMRSVLVILHARRKDAEILALVHVVLRPRVLWSNIRPSAIARQDLRETHSLGAPKLPVR